MEDAVTTVIKQALSAAGGRLRLANAEEFILGELERSQFNADRAIEVYTIAS
jgi:hypothetical protein